MNITTGFAILEHQVGPTCLSEQGGQPRYFEHVVSDQPALARLERLLDTTLYPPLAGGCHCSRDTGAAIRQAGFQIEQKARIAVREAQLGPSVQHILGTARRA